MYWRSTTTRAFSLTFISTYGRWCRHRLECGRPSRRPPRNQPSGNIPPVIIPDTPSHAYTLYPINGSVRLFARIMTVREMAPIQQKVIALTEACLLAFGTTCPGLSTVSISTFLLLASWPGTKHMSTESRGSLDRKST
jgi:hypothetical protein